MQKPTLGQSLAQDRPYNNVVDPLFGRPLGYDTIALGNDEQNVKESVPGCRKEIVKWGLALGLREREGLVRNRSGGRI